MSGSVRMLPVWLCLRMASCSAHLPPLTLVLWNGDSFGLQGPA